MIKKIKDWLNPNKQFKFSFAGHYYQVQRIKDDEQFRENDRVYIGDGAGKILYFACDSIHVCVTLPHDKNAIFEINDIKSQMEIDVEEINSEGFWTHDTES